MGTAAVAVEAPSGSHFEFEPVRTAKGTQELGDVPILVWDDLDKAIEFYTHEGVIAVLDGTSLRVSFQNIARRLKTSLKDKTDDEINEAIAEAQVKFRPGKRAGGVSTPGSRVARAAKAATEKGADAEKLEALLAKIASGDIDLADLLK
jgi:hypothetical protein